MDLKRGLPNIELDIPLLESLWKKSTPVVAWYAHGNQDGTVRGPFCRWFTCSEIQPEYQQHCGTIQDDVNYAAAALNSIPHLIAAYRTQCDHSAKLAGQLEAAKAEIQLYADKLSKLRE